MLIPSEQRAEPLFKRAVDRAGSARYRGNECRVNARNESGTAEEIKAFVSYLGDKGFLIDNVQLTIMVPLRDKLIHSEENSGIVNCQLSIHFQDRKL